MSDQAPPPKTALSLKDKIEIAEKLIKIAALFVVAIWAIWKFGAEFAIDARKPFLEKQLEFCIEASSSAALLAVTEEEETYTQRREKFLELFYGPLAIVENGAVAKAMIAYKDVLLSLDFDGDRAKLNGPSLDIAHTCRDLVQDSWRYTGLQ